MNKYDVKFCGCGTVHFIENELIDTVCLTEDRKAVTGRSIIHVCRRCGATIQRGLDNCMDGFSYYSHTINDEIFIPDPVKHYTILSKGVRMLMKSGNFAENMRAGIFIDEAGLKEELHGADLFMVKGIGRDDAVLPFKDVDAINVNMDWLLKQITEEQAKSICGYYVKGLNWAGTPYETSSNVW